MENIIVKLNCIDITIDFYGVCKNDGLVVFVKGLIPGETANIKIIKIKNKIAFGIIDELLEPSNYRIKPMCPVSYKCGGCNIQHIDYSFQLVLKKRIVENTFKNMKLSTRVLDPIASKDIFSYRNKIQVPFADGKIGYYRNHSNDIVEFDKCLINKDIDNDILNFIKKSISLYDYSGHIRHIVIRHLSDGIMVCLVSNTDNLLNISDFVFDLVKSFNQINSVMININNDKTNVIFGEKDICVYGNDYIVDKCSDYSFMVPLRSFYQINSFQMKNLYDLIINNGDLNKDNKVLDLFCGIGTISIYISKFVKEVLGVEIIDKSVEYANKNKLLNNINNVNFVKADANDIGAFIDGYDTVILDPPRKGINNNLVEQLINSKVNKIIYISCNQATLARDLKSLSNEFIIGDTQLVDMFPQTKHIESITVIKRI